MYNLASNNKHGHGVGWKLSLLDIAYEAMKVVVIEAMYRGKMIQRHKGFAVSLQH